MDVLSSTVRISVRKNLLINTVMESIHAGLMTWLQNMGLSEKYAQWALLLASVLAMLVLIAVVNKICRMAIVPAVRKMTSKTSTKWDDYLLNDDVLNKACGMIPPVMLSLFLPLVVPENPDLMWFVKKFCDIYLVISILKLLCSLINALYTMSGEHEKMKDKSMKGFYQMLKLVVICVGVIIIISSLLDKSPVVILTGLGAGAAILMLVFQDTIKGLVAGVQLTANDMVRPGDWISMPKYGADGDVIEVSLTTVKVRNWDKTITTVPPYALVNDSFQNWRGMFDTGGRRVKRSVNIDMQSIRFCTPEEMEYYREQPWMEGYEPTGYEDVNLQVFRQYIDYYLRHHARVHQDMLILVRQLQPEAHGLPLELYFFSASTMWVKYEALQAEVFEHVLAMAPKFDLKIFQSPTGQDVQKIVR